MESCAEVQRVVVDLIQRHRPKRVILDLGRVTFLDSAGIRALLTCRRLAVRHGSELESGRAHDNVRQVLTITSLLDVFNL
jgi:anti-anti-sigma factor